MKRGILWTATGLVVVAAASALAVLLLGADDPVPGVIEGSGPVRGTEVTLSAKIGGVAEVVAVREGQAVKARALVAQIGAKDIEARLAQTRAEAEAAAAQVDEVDAQLEAMDAAIEQARLSTGVTRDTLAHGAHRAGEALRRADAEVRVAQAEQKQARAAYERFEVLSRQGFVSASYMDEVRARARVADAKLAAALRAREEARAAEQRARAATGEVAVRELDERRLRADKARLIASRAALESRLAAARAGVAEVEAALADTRLVAPADGTVIDRLVEPGELLAPGTPVATLVDLNDLYVRVYVAEKDVGKLRLGNSARIAVDAFPNRSFGGKVVEVAQRAEFTPKEAHMKDEREKLVFGVKVRVENPQGYLKPGMPADVTIRWKPLR